ncbi:MBL fold metallo-hydrolase [Ruania albidiflava]|uniref:MBL fold metallo-hydrolase n=1 Tax=Ruania albidiflava TaxID=366586 RepID=UPI0003B2FE29|nr:MBL fold metallo-hydrolase [Ruania albidiflava]
MTAPIDVAPGVLVLTSRTMCTTSTVVHDGKRALLVDPAWHADELEGIADLLTARDLRVELGWATHAHHDHLLWHPRFGPAPRLATPSAAATARAQLTEIRTALAPTLPAELRALAGQVQELDGAQLPWSGPVAEVVVHHGHSPGHGALWLPEVRVLLAGDMLSETEIPLCAETGIDAYVRGLERLAPYVARAQVLVPGHGSPAYADNQDSPMARLAADRTYLDALAAGTGEQDPRLRDAPDWLLAEHEANAASR